jgi:ABC-type branched-subunit amino acid transport system substrate-binding protein
MRSHPGRLAACGAVLALAACGTRLPDSSFTPAVGDVVAGAPLPSATATAAGPRASASAVPGVSGAPGVVPSGAPGGGGGTTGADEPNTASDVGVTAATITLGTISSRTNPFDPTAFVGPLYGAQAFVADLNRRGGIHGRTVRLVSCDDHGDGARNNECVHQLVDTEKVFALVSNAIFRYDGAAYVQAKGVPDVGSQPVDTAYTRYSHLWDIYGEAYPRAGKVGFDGRLEGGTEVYRYFKTRFPKVPLKAGVVYYNQADSQRYAEDLVKGLQAEGYQAIPEEVNFALPDYDSAVLDLRAQGVTYVYDVLDAGGNENLCASMDANGLSQQVTAKVTTTQSWVAAVATEYDSSPVCRNKIWATGNTLNFDDTRYPQVAAFRAAMTRQRTDSSDQLSEWALEGWAGAQWLADAMASCGARLTRGCVEGYLRRPQEYDGHGLLTPRDFVARKPVPHEVNCLNVARWRDGSGGAKGSWVSQVPDMARNCFDVPNVYYTP